MASYDINDLVVSSVLRMLGARGEPPSPPANILDDYAGGSLAAFASVVLALIHPSSSGKGQLVEANMVGGASNIGTVPRLRTKEPLWMSKRGTNVLDGGCP
jgi:alpha-methylacyl-CoA racemase